MVIIREFVRIILGWFDQGPVWDNSPIYPILDTRNFVWYSNFILSNGRIKCLPIPVKEPPFDISSGKGVSV